MSFKRTTMLRATASRRSASTTSRSGRRARRVLSLKSPSTWSPTGAEVATITIAPSAPGESPLAALKVATRATWSAVCTASARRPCCGCDFDSSKRSRSLVKHSCAAAWRSLGAEIRFECGAGGLENCLHALVPGCRNYVVSRQCSNWWLWLRF